MGAPQGSATERKLEQKEENGIRKHVVNYIKLKHKTR